MRLDKYLADSGQARSRSQAAEAVRAGRVVVNGVVLTKPSAQVASADEIVMAADHYVSRAAHKLLGALADTGLVVPPVVLDAGASTGGFTQVLLERGAQRVFAVDVGHGQLHESLAADPRVVNLEKLNLRELTPTHLGGLVDLVVGDVSFISLTLLVEPLLGVLKPEGQLLLLVKPQFEVGRGGLDSRGVVTDEAAREAAVARVVAALAAGGAVVDWSGRSALPGPAGNVEFFLLATKHQPGITPELRV